VDEAVWEGVSVRVGVLEAVWEGVSVRVGVTVEVRVVVVVAAGTNPGFRIRGRCRR